MSWFECPEAISPTRVPTVTRRPRTQGFPPMTSGSMVMRLKCVIVSVPPEIQTSLSKVLTTSPLAQAADSFRSAPQSACLCDGAGSQIFDPEFEMSPVGWRRPLIYGVCDFPKGLALGDLLIPTDPFPGSTYPVRSRTSSSTTTTPPGNSPSRASPDCCACSSTFPGAS